jgi:DNA-binding MarR family transcriptional regulator
MFLDGQVYLLSRHLMEHINHPESQLLHAVRKLYAAMNRFDHKVSASLRIHPSDLRCVNALEQGERTPSDLATELGLTSGSMTALLDRLERAGFVHRQRAPVDRRSVLVHLLPRARQRIGRIYAELGMAIQASGLQQSPQRQKAAVHAIQTLAEAFDQSAESSLSTR